MGGSDASAKSRAKKHKATRLSTKGSSWPLDLTFAGRDGREERPCRNALDKFSPLGRAYGHTTPSARQHLFKSSSFGGQGNRCRVQLVRLLSKLAALRYNSHVCFFCFCSGQQTGTRKQIRGCRPQCASRNSMLKSP